MIHYNDSEFTESVQEFLSHFMLHETQEKLLEHGYSRDSDGLYCLPSYMGLTHSEKAEICNGIGACSGLSKFMSSRIWGLDCTEAGNKHDHCYSVGGDTTDRAMADLAFLVNLYLLIQKGCFLFRWLRRSRARKYYLALRIGGYRHFSFK